MSQPRSSALVGSRRPPASQLALVGGQTGWLDRSLARSQEPAESAAASSALRQRSFLFARPPARPLALAGLLGKRAKRKRRKSAPAAHKLAQLTPLGARSPRPRGRQDCAGPRARAAGWRASERASEGRDGEMANTVKTKDRQSKEDSKKQKKQKRRGRRTTNDERPTTNDERPTTNAASLETEELGVCELWRQVLAASSVGDISPTYVSRQRSKRRRRDFSLSLASLCCRRTRSRQSRKPPPPELLCC